MVFDEATGCGSVPADYVKDYFYHLCSDAQVDRARGLPRQWQALAPGSTPVSLSPGRGESVPRYYIECRQDRAVSLDVQRRMHANAGVRAVAALDSDHSPFMSRPAELAQALDGFVRA